MTLIGFQFWTSGQACSCFSKADGFIKNSQFPDIVVVVKVESYGEYFTRYGDSLNVINQPLSATFEIIDVLKGKETRREVKAFGDDGGLCRPYIDNFRIEKYYVIGLFKCRDLERKNGGKETKEDYYVSICGEFWLEVDFDKNTVSGLIEDKEKSLTWSLDNLKTKLRNK